MTTAPIEWMGAVVAIAATLVGLSVLIYARKAVQHTTLRASWWWALLAFVAWSSAALVVECLPESGRLPWLGPVNFAAYALSLCPVVAVIGAKRPQHAAWNLVVLSLWVIVALPAAEALLLRFGQQPNLGPGRVWFLRLVVLLGPVNFVPTRYWLASLLVAAGQLIAFGAVAKLPVPLPGLTAAALGLVVCVVGIMAALLAFRKTATRANPFDRLWADFRDSFGLFWALRVQERVNAAAKQYGWDLELTWLGFRQPGNAAPLAAIPPAIERPLSANLKGLLRRFVSSAWIAKRRETPLD
jgi:hypothetical protein